MPPPEWGVNNHFTSAPSFHNLNPSPLTAPPNHHYNSHPPIPLPTCHHQRNTFPPGLISPHPPTQQPPLPNPIATMMTRTILPTITLIALAMLPGSSAAPPTALSATPATPGTAANPDVFCCTITCKSCVQVDCSKDDTGCYHVLPVCIEVSFKGWLLIVGCSGGIAAPWRWKRFRGCIRM